MAKRRKTKKRVYRRNPSRRRRVVRRVRSGFAGLNFRSALKNIPLQVIGMFATKWAAKRGTPDALETDPSTWNGMTYLKGGMGAVGAGFLANMVKPGSGQKVLEGGLTLLLYKVAQNHLIPKNSFLTGQFGGYDGYGFGAAGGGYTPGEVAVNEGGEPFILGDDMEWVPMDDGAEYAGYGEEDDWTMMGLGQNALEVPGPLGFSDVLEPVGRLGAPMTEDAYARFLINR